MKKKITFLLSMFIALALLNACESDENQMLQKQTSLSSLSLEKADEVNGFMPLNYVPAEVAKRMTAEELEVWKEASSHFFLNYSFMDTKYYAKNKESVLKRVRFLVEQSKKNKMQPSELCFIWEMDERVMNAFSNKIKFMNYEDTTDIGNDPTDLDNDSTSYTEMGERELVWTYKINNDSIPGAEITLSTKYEVYNTQWGTYYAKTAPTCITYYPSDAFFSGEASFNIYGYGYANAIINGTLTYQKVSISVKSSREYELWKKH